MHVGHHYPFLFQFWQAECFFWPGYVPRRIFVQGPAGFGSSWDRLVPGLVTDIGQPDFFLAGDPAWEYLDPGGLWDLQVLFHKVGLSPVVYSINVRLREFVPNVTSVVDGEVAAPQYTFGGWILQHCSNFPPFSLGVVPPLTIRAATWSEV